MSIQFKNENKIGRNQLCPCGLGLKYKDCHGDETKKNVVQRVADEAMIKLIAQELLKKGLICVHGVRTGEDCLDCENPEPEINLDKDEIVGEDSP